MRLDKFLSITKTATRKEASSAARLGNISVNGITVNSADIHIDPEKDEILFCSVKVEYRKFIYVLLNKPQGVVSATEDTREKTVLDLLDDDLRKYNLFPCGRLDKYTTGLIMLTNDGELAHKLLSPKHHVSKTYAFCCAEVLSLEDVGKLEAGVYIEGGYLTKPCTVKLNEDKTGGTITITEGKYHQIKQMLYAVGNEITALKRITFGPLNLDGLEGEGSYRNLSDKEINMLRELVNKEK